jgi:hypothetical protein
VKEQLPWRDTHPGPLKDAGPNAVLLQMSDQGLAIISANHERVWFAAPLDDVELQPPTSFVDWWNRSILTDKSGNSFSRADLVLTVANQDGGGHVDPKLKPTYAALSREHSHGVRLIQGGNGGGLGFIAGIGSVPEGDPIGNSLALANVRQIAHEAITTLDAQLIRVAGDISVRVPICSLSFFEPPTAGRNDPCPCGSGRKFKKCFGRRKPRTPFGPPD